MRQPRYYVGINKGGHHSGVCVFDQKAPRLGIEVWLDERISRVKNQGGWPVESVSRVHARLEGADAVIAENCDGPAPIIQEHRFNIKAPLHNYLKARKLERYSSCLNQQIRFVPHHLCHAAAATELSPFRKALVIVLDGAGNRYSAFRKHPEESFMPEGRGEFDGERTEACSVYLMNEGKLRCVHKEWQVAIPMRKDSDTAFGSGIGLFCETAATYIFNSKYEAGKVMGLAPFGRPSPVVDRLQHTLCLDWDRAFHGQGKEEWERDEQTTLGRYANLAATVQLELEKSLIKTLLHFRSKYRDYDHLILTGGCALNSLANARILELGLFKNIYVPPFPGDESIAFGAIARTRSMQQGYRWKPVPFERQTAAFGPRDSVPTPAAIKRAFRGYAISKPLSLERTVAQYITHGHVVGWFQGRSESGPRALGHRSILASPLAPGIKNLLNSKVKKRESFRPYGVTCLWEKAPAYFDVAQGFESPFMHFSPTIREEFRDRLKEICHIDSSCRVQTLHRAQNPLFYDLIREFGRLSGVFCLLNTSLNVMGEPIAETVEDCRRFFDQTPVDAMVVGAFMIKRKKSRERK